MTANHPATGKEGVGNFPALLNEKFRLQSYDGGAYKSKGNYNLKNVLTPTLEPFHSSGQGGKLTAVFKSTNDCTFTHLFFSTNLTKCNDALKAGLFWVLSDQPDVSKYAKFDNCDLAELKEKFGMLPQERIYEKEDLFLSKKKNTATSKAAAVSAKASGATAATSSSSSAIASSGTSTVVPGAVSKSSSVSTALPALGAGGAAAAASSSSSQPGSGTTAAGGASASSSTTGTTSNKPQLVVPKIGFSVAPFGSFSAASSAGAGAAAAPSSSSSAPQAGGVEGDGGKKKKDADHNIVDTTRTKGKAEVEDQQTPAKDAVMGDGGNIDSKVDDEEKKEEAELDSKVDDEEKKEEAELEGNNEDEDKNQGTTSTTTNFLDQVQLKLEGPYYFETDKDTKEVEIELSPWIEGKYVLVKFMDSWSDKKENFDLAVMGLLGFPGKQKKKEKKQEDLFGPIWHRQYRKPIVHPCLLRSMYSSSGWVCDGRDFPGGCRSRQTDFNQTSVYTMTFRSSSTGVDLCEKCVRDPCMGQVTKEIAKQDVEALVIGCHDRGDFSPSDVHVAKLASVRICTAVRRNWRYVLPFYLEAGLLEAMQHVMAKIDDIVMSLDEGNFRLVSASASSAAEKARRQPKPASNNNSSEENGNNGNSANPNKSSSSSRKGGSSSLECHKRILRQCMHSLMTDISHCVFFGYRGDLHPGDQVYYKVDTATSVGTAVDQGSSSTSSNKTWYQGKFINFSDDGEYAIVEGPPDPSVTATKSGETNKSSNSGSPKNENALSKLSSLFRSALPGGGGSAVAAQPSAESESLKKALELQHPARPVEHRVNPMYCWRKSTIVPPSDGPPLSAPMSARSGKTDIMKTLELADEVCRGPDCDLSKVQSLVKLSDTMCTNGQGCTLLFLAVLHNCPNNILKCLIEEGGASVEVGGLRSGISLFELAQGNGYDLEGLKLLDSAERRTNNHPFMQENPLTGEKTLPESFFLKKASGIEGDGAAVGKNEVLWGSSDDESLSDRGSKGFEEKDSDEDEDELNPEQNLSKIFAEGGTKKRRLNASPDGENANRDSGKNNNKDDDTKRKKKKQKKSKSKERKESLKKEKKSKKALNSKPSTEDIIDVEEQKNSLEGGATSTSNKSWHFLSVNGFREKFGAKLLPLIHQVITAYPVMQGNFAPCQQKESSMMGSMTQIIQAAEKLLSATDNTWAGTVGPRLAASSLQSPYTTDGPSAKQMLQVIDQLPIEGLYALEPMVKNPALIYDILYSSRPAYQAFTKILQAIVTTDSLEIAYHGCQFLNLIASYRNFLVYKMDDTSCTEPKTPTAKKIPDNVFPRLIKSHGGLKWAERIVEAKLPLTPATKKTKEASSALATSNTGRVNPSGGDHGVSAGVSSSSSSLGASQPNIEAASLLGFYRHTDLGKKDTLPKLRAEAEKLISLLTGTGSNNDTAAINTSETTVSTTTAGAATSSSTTFGAATEASSTKNVSNLVSITTTSAQESFSSASSCGGGGGTNSEQLQVTVSPFSKISSLSQASGLEIRECLCELRQLLHDTRARSLIQEADAATCSTSFELASVCAIPGSLLEVLQQCERNLLLFHEVFQDIEDFKRLTSFLHEVIDLGETFPVWKHKVDRGLRALTDMYPLRLNRALFPGAGGEKSKDEHANKRNIKSTTPIATALSNKEEKQKASALVPQNPLMYLPDSLRTQDFFVTVEPLVTVQELSHYLQQITPITDESYLRYCFDLVGSVIRVRNDREYLVTEFTVFPGEIHLPMHTLKPLPVVKESTAFSHLVPKSPLQSPAESKTANNGNNDDETPVQMVLNLRQYEVLSLPENKAFTLEKTKFLSLLMVLKVSLSPRDYTDALMHLVDGVDLAAVKEEKTLVRMGDFGSAANSPVDAKRDDILAKSAVADALVVSTNLGSPKPKTIVAGGQGNKKTFPVNEHQIEVLKRLQDALLGGSASGKAAETDSLASLRTCLIEELDNCRVYLEQRCAGSSGLLGAAGAGAEKKKITNQQVDPAQKCHTVFIVHTGGADVPFDMIWGMLRDDIINAVRELCPRSSLQSEETLQAGITANGMGPLAKCLTMAEAERLAARVGNCLQTAVQVDHDEFAKIKEKEEQLQQQALSLAAKRGSLNSATAAHLSAGLRVQFASKPLSGSGSGAGSSASSSANKNKDPYDSKGVILARSTNLLGHDEAAASQALLGGNKSIASPGSEITFDILDDSGVLFECLPKARVKISKSDLEKLNRSASSTSVSAQDMRVSGLGPIMRLRDRMRSAFPSGLAGESEVSRDPPASRGLFGGAASESKGAGKLGDDPSYRRPGHQVRSSGKGPESSSAEKGSGASAFGSGKGWFVNSSAGPVYIEEKGGKKGKKVGIFKGSSADFWSSLGVVDGGKGKGKGDASGSTGKGRSPSLARAGSSRGAGRGPIDAMFQAAIDASGENDPASRSIFGFGGASAASAAANQPPALSALSGSSSAPAAAAGAAAAAAPSGGEQMLNNVSAAIAAQQENSSASSAANEISSFAEESVRPDRAGESSAAASDNNGGEQQNQNNPSGDSNPMNIPPAPEAPAPPPPDHDRPAAPFPAAAVDLVNMQDDSPRQRRGSVGNDSERDPLLEGLPQGGDSVPFEEEEEEVSISASGERPENENLDGDINRSGAAGASSNNPNNDDWMEDSQYDDGEDDFYYGVDDHDDHDSEGDEPSSGGILESFLGGGAGGAASSSAAVESGSQAAAALSGVDISGRSRDRLLEQLVMMEEMFAGGRSSRSGAGGVSSGNSRSAARGLSGSIFSLLSGGAGGRGGGGFDDDLLVSMGGGHSSDRHRSSAQAVESLKRVGEFPLKASLPGFTRTAEVNDPRSTLEHPVSERVTQAELESQLEYLLPEQDNVNGDNQHNSVLAIESGMHAEAQATQRTQANTSGNNSIVEHDLLNALDAEFREVRATFRLLEKTTPTDSCTTSSHNSDGTIKQVDTFTPVCNLEAYPLRWNLFKLFQRLADIQHCASFMSTAEAMKFPARVNGLRRVPLSDWALEFCMDVQVPDLSGVPRLHGSMLNCSGSEELRSMAEQLMQDLQSDSEQKQQHPSKKRRLKTIDEENREDLLTNQAVARDLYSTEASLFGPEKNHPFLLSTFCSNSESVLDCLELLSVLKNSYLKRHYAPLQGDNSSTSEDLMMQFSGQQLIPGAPTAVEQELTNARALKHNSHKFWINQKLDRKLRAQLDDPLSIITGALPWWVQTLARICPFLFSITTRKLLLKYTAFGQAYGIHWIQENKLGPFLKRRQTLQTELNAAAMDPRKTQILSQELSNVEEHIIRNNHWVGSLQAALTKIEKNDQIIKIASMALQRLQVFPSCCRTMEVQFENETGFGHAVTQSFYVELANRLIEREANRITPMWVEDDGSLRENNLHVGQMCRSGLLIRPLKEVPAKVLQQFEFFGRLVGKALREGFIVPVPLSEEFFALVRDMDVSSSSLPRPGTGYDGEFVGLMAEYVRDITTRTRSARNAEEKLEIMKQEALRKDFRERYLRSKDMDNSPSKALADQPCSFADYCSDLGACFLETGFNGTELMEDGENVEITFENVESFVQQATDFWFKRGVEKQVKAFQKGFNDIMPLQSLQCLSPKELMDMICGEDQIEWDLTSLQAHLHPSGALSADHPVYKNLLDLLVEMEFKDRQRFLDFVTSCPRLPPGGMAKVHIEICGLSATSSIGAGPGAAAAAAANKKAASGGNSKLPYSRACSSQLYLPVNYTNKEDLRVNLHEAMYSSVGSHEHR